MCVNLLSLHQIVEASTSLNSLMTLVEKPEFTFYMKKAGVFEVFKQFKALVEKKSSHYVKCLRTNRERELTSNIFFLISAVSMA